MQCLPTVQAAALRLQGFTTLFESTQVDPLQLLPNIHIMVHKRVALIEKIC